MKFRKKPVVIEALQLSWGTWGEMCDFADVGFLKDGKPQGGKVDNEGGFHEGMTGDKIAMAIPTLEGLMVAQENDWIIKGVKGEFYPCKPDIFEATYERVEE